MTYDTLVDICFRLGISAGKEVDIGLGGGCDKPLSPADMLLYSWDEGLDVCVDLIPLTQSGMVYFVPGRALIDATHCKRVKYEAKCADIGYSFLPFSFSSLGELDKDADHCPAQLAKRLPFVIISKRLGVPLADTWWRLSNDSLPRGGGSNNSSLQVRGGSSNMAGTRGGEAHDPRLPEAHD
ncbi:hypothetical protein Tco_1086397 [Tanacetum coccineum]